jgi:outer membrane protein assembly factor BamA
MSDLRFFFLTFFIFLITTLCSEVIIQEIIFEGNQQISDNFLKRNITSKVGKTFLQSNIEHDIEIIQNIYLNKQIYNFKIHTPEIELLTHETVKIIFHLEETEELIIDSLVITGNNYIGKGKLKNYISTENISISTLALKITQLVDFYNDSGFLFAQVQIDSIRSEDARIIAYLKIAEGRFSNPIEFLFKGNQNSSEKSLLRISQLSRYNTITPKILQQAEKRILKKSYIRNCQILPLDNEKILIDIEEDKMTHFSGILGYNNNRKGDKKITGFLILEFLNLFGTDRSLGLTWQKLNPDRSYIKLAYHESGPWQIPLSGDFSISREEVDSTYIRSEIVSEIFYYGINSKYGFNIAHNTIYPGSRRPEIVSKNDITTVGIFWDYSSHFYEINPLTGNEIRLGLYNTFFRNKEAKDTRQGSELFWQTYLNPFRKNVLAIAFNLKAVENKNLQDYELFRLGGIKNLRGYNQDQFQGQLIFWTNLEYRYLLSYNSRAFIFFDYGFVRNDQTDIGKLFSLGFGLRLKTRLGLLGIDYGVGYENGKFRNPLDGIVHFGLETKL